MHHRAVAILAIICFAFGAGGCESFSRSPRKNSSTKKKQYQEVLMPLQTGSTLQRRAYIERGPDPTEPKKKSKKKEPASKTDAEPAETPPAVEEPSPPPDRFR